MLLATVLLSAALVPQTAAEEIETPFDTPEAVPESAAGAVQESAAEAVPAMEATPMPEEEPAPLAPPPAPEPAATSPAAPTGSGDDHIAAGLKAFRRGRFSTARDAFQKAYAAAPGSPAAAFYLGYAHYKLGEPSRRMDGNKEKARELFAQAYTLDPMFQPVWGRPKAE